jgi:hypothetical protein
VIDVDGSFAWMELELSFASIAAAGGSASMETVGELTLSR